MSTTKTLALEEQRSRLERRANVLRSRLLRTIDALDTRRHQVTAIGHQAKKLVGPVAATMLGAAVLAVGTTMAIRAVVERRRERSFGYRLAKSLAPLMRPARPPFWQEAMRRVALVAVGLAASELVKRGARALAEGGRPLLLSAGPAPVAPLPPAS